MDDVLEPSAEIDALKQSLAKAEELAKAANNAAKYWHFNYCDFFFQPNTKNVLWWLASREQGKTIYAIFEESGVVVSDKERHAIVEALQANSMIELIGFYYSVTAYGREYVARKRWDPPRV
jgi:hypothetical protein